MARMMDLVHSMLHARTATSTYVVVCFLVATVFSVKGEGCWVVCVCWCLFVSPHP